MFSGRKHALSNRNTAGYFSGFRGAGPRGGRNAAACAFADSQQDPRRFRLRRLPLERATRWRRCAATDHRRTRRAAGIFARWKMDRVFRAVRRKHRCVCHARGGRRAAQADLASRSRHRRGMDSGRQARAFSFRARSLRGLRPPLQRSSRRRSGRCSSHVARRRCLALS